MPVYFVVFLLMNSSVPDSDNYIQYYNLCNDAELDYLQGNYSAALKKTQAAFDLVDYVHAKRLLMAARIASKNNNNKLVYKYLKQAFSQGLEESEVKSNDDFLDFGKTKYFNKLFHEYSELHTRYQSHVDQALCEEIDSLYYIDQHVIRKSESPPEKVYNISLEDFKGKNIDSLVFKSLQDLIKKHGFPSERNASSKTLREAYVILHHNIRLTTNQAYLSWLKTLLNKGLYHPFWYAWAFDQNLIFYKKQRPQYFCGVPPAAYKIEPSEFNSIDIKRREIGLEILELDSLRNQSR